MMDTTETEPATAKLDLLEICAMSVLLDVLEALANLVNAMQITLCA
jgi:hypothetical protein